MVYAAVDLNLSVQELIAVPQLDAWSRAGYSSSSFVVEALRQLGALDIRMNASEFTVKDVYQLAIYNTAYEKP